MNVLDVCNSFCLSKRQRFIVQIPLQGRPAVLPDSDLATPRPLRDGEDPNDLLQAYWRDGDRVFWLRSSDLDALELAATVRPATGDEWTAVPDRPQYDGDPILPG